MSAYATLSLSLYRICVRGVGRMRNSLQAWSDGHRLVVNSCSIEASPGCSSSAIWSNTWLKEWVCVHELRPVNIIAFLK